MVAVCRFCLIVHMSVDCSFVSLPLQRFLRPWAALELFCCVAREKGHNRANPKPFAFSAFPSTFLAVIRRVISVSPYNPFTTDSWSSSVSGVFPLSFIFPFHYKSVCFFRLSPQFLLLFSIFCQSYFKQRPKFCVMVRQGK